MPRSIRFCAPASFPIKEGARTRSAVNATCSSNPSSTAWRMRSLSLSSSAEGIASGPSCSGHLDPSSRRL